MRAKSSHQSREQGRCIRYLLMGAFKDQQPREETLVFESIAVNIGGPIEDEKRKAKSWSGGGGSSEGVALSTRYEIFVSASICHPRRPAGTLRKCNKASVPPTNRIKIIWQTSGAKDQQFAKAIRIEIA
jgi:hypothetical protein